MNDIMAALLLGVIAEAIDVLPMLKTKIPRASILFIFSQWVLIGFLIPFVNWKIAFWLKGLIIGTLGMIPVALITYPRNKKAVPGILIFGVILGAGVGLASDWLIN